MRFSAFFLSAAASRAIGVLADALHVRYTPIERLDQFTQMPERFRSTGASRLCGHQYPLLR